MNGADGAAEWRDAFLCTIEEGDSASPRL